MQEGAGSVIIRDIVKEDIPYLVPIGMSQLGVDYISDEDFIEAMEDPG